MHDLLINKSHVSKIAQVANGVSRENFKKYCYEAQIFDFKKLVCEEFFFDLLENYTDEKYQKLLNGGSYTYDERIIHFKGLNDVLSYFAYSRFLISHNIQSGSFGIVQKKTNHSEPISLREREKESENNNQKANQLWVDVNLFLEREKDTYTAYDCGSCESSEQLKIEVWG